MAKYIRVVTTDDKYVSDKPYGAVGDKAKFEDPAAAELDAEFRNKKAKEMGIKTRYKAVL